jgi:transposase
MAKINNDELLRLLKEGNMTQREMAAHFGCSEAAIAKKKKRYKKLGLYNEFEIPEAFMDLSDKERKFVLARIEGKSQGRAVLEAGYDCTTSESARSMGSQLAKRDDIKVAISELMWDRGLTRTVRIDKLKEHLWNKDPNTSLRSIDIANRMEGLYGTDRHLHLHMTREDYDACEREIADLDREIRQLEQELGNDIVDV